MRDYLNKKVKFREKFRPFAPAILEEQLDEYFDINQKSEHMLIACNVKKEKIKFQLQYMLIIVVVFKV